MAAFLMNVYSLFKKTLHKTFFKDDELEARIPTSFMTFDEHVSSIKMPRNLGFLLAPTNCFSLCQIYVSDVSLLCCLL